MFISSSAERRNRVRLSMVLVATTITSLQPAVVMAATALYAIDSLDPVLSVVDRETGEELSFVEITVAGETIVNSTGLAVNPTTNEMFAAVKLSSAAGAGRNLIKINPQTGVATNIGNMGQPIAGLTFVGNTLYGVSGDCANNCGGSATPETLFMINTSNALATFVQTLGNGNDGEAIAYREEDGHVYHLSGTGASMVFEKIHPLPGTVTGIPLSGDSIQNREAIGFEFDPDQNVFVGSIIDWGLGEGDFIHLTANGVVTVVSALQFAWKDFAFYDAGTFADVPPDYWAYTFIERLAAAGVTSGCGGGNYCPLSSVTRAQMAVFLERGIHGSDYAPPPASGAVFSDVPAGVFAASFIEQLAADGITSGCGNGQYCPNSTVTREQMAVFLLRGKHGADYVPPAATGVFADVPVNHQYARWIERLAAEGITSGCGGGNYCPKAAVNRDQMAVFLVRAFGL